MVCTVNNAHLFVPGDKMSPYSSGDQVRGEAG